MLINWGEGRKDKVMMIVSGDRVAKAVLAHTLSRLLNCHR